MTLPRRTERLAGCGYALLAVAAGIPAAWQGLFGDVGLAMWMIATACLAARCSTALQTIARQRVRLTDPRREEGSK
ncbi:hypothetical protein AB0J35_57895 [Nonomuraea angiospora]|uniref:hypothetical protein n=1 Tax=Nonomuraea angiospora TaxID=46172 RepID=UPI003443C7FD